MFLCQNPNTEHPYPIPEREQRRAYAHIRVSCFRLPTHTYHGYGLSVEPRGEKCPSLLDPSCLFHHTSILGSSITCLYTRLPSASNLVEFLVFSAEKDSENPYYTRGKSRLLERLLPVSYLSTLTLPIPSPVYGIISRCPMYRIQVASESANNLSSSSLLQEFI